MSSKHLTKLYYSRNPAYADTKLAPKEMVVGEIFTLNKFVGRLRARGRIAGLPNVTLIPRLPDVGRENRNQVGFVGIVIQGARDNVWRRHEERSEGLKDSVKEARLLWLDLLLSKKKMTQPALLCPAPCVLGPSRKALKLALK
jgi:hypothetical protein